MISKEAPEEFKAIWKKEFSEELEKNETESK